MSKELEAIECSLKLYKMVESAGNNNGFNLNEAWEYHENIKQTLLELKAIKEANPSEALGCLERVNVHLETEFDRGIWNKQCNTIKQALIKAQEQEKKLKALEIIKNKKVNMYHIWVFDNYQQYKEHYPFSEYHAIEDMLTFEEFNLVKEVFG